MTFLALVATELRRFELRRAVRWMVVLGLLIVVVVNVVQLARSEVSAASATSEHIVQGPNGPVPVRIAHDAEDRRVRVGRTFEQTIRGLGIGLVMFGVLLGSTFIAAEFGASGLSTQLIFEPRRVRLYVAKTLAVFIGAAVSAAIIIVWAGLLQLLVSALRGSTAGVDAGWLGERATDVVRASSACGLGAVCATAVASIARRTVVAVGVLYGLTAGTGFLGGVTWGEPLARVSPMNTLFGMGYGDLNDPEGFFGLRTLTGAVTISLVWVLVVSVIGAWWFERREIR
ncbi:MAG: hypothetical protein JO291_11000 [Acidimicrobiia bacterium]|nr:hypothetical protein [Acidimicrobiia bacterium]